MTRIEEARADGYSDGVAMSVVAEFLTHAKGAPLAKAEEVIGLATMKNLTLKEIGQRMYAARNMPRGAGRVKKMLQGK